MRILIVEQDAALGVFLKKGLTVEGHDVRWAGRPEEARQLADSERFDLMVLDAEADPELNLLTTVHRVYRRTTVLTLLRRDTVEDRVRSLDSGADDCMAKPFSFHELTARCRALLRRQERSGELVLMHGNLMLDRISRSVSVSGRTITLTGKEFRLLEFLLQHAGRCCSRGELLEEVFGLPADNATNVIDVYINYLRKKLSSGGPGPRILTVRGAGYRLPPTEMVSGGQMGVSIETLHASA